MALQWHKVIKYDPENKILMLAAAPGIWESDRGMVFTPETPTGSERILETTGVIWHQAEMIQKTIRESIMSKPRSQGVTRI